MALTITSASSSSNPSQKGGSNNQEPMQLLNKPLLVYKYSSSSYFSLAFLITYYLCEECTFLIEIGTLILLSLELLMQ